MLQVKIAQTVVKFSIHYLNLQILSLIPPTEELNDSGISLDIRLGVNIIGSNLNL